jgi:succinoglycan biosynthesis protein ExoM
VKSPQITLIGVPTGGRAEDLQRLLKALASDYATRDDVRLLVVDNSAEGAARPIFDEYASGFGDRGRYIHEPHRGYANVRNAVINNIGDVDTIAMIDDDEVPAPGWLDNLRAAQERTGADIVAGPIAREFPPGTPSWYAASGVFGLEAPDFPEGGEMPWCATNNTLVLAGVLERVPEGFDPKFNPMSGEDTHFFMRARLRGCRIVWTHTAVVHEFLPQSRFTRRWIFQRAIRAGNSRAVIEFELVGGPKTRITRAAKTLGLFGLGIGSTGAAWLRRDKALRLRAVHRLGLAYGMALGFKSSAPWSP